MTNQTNKIRESFVFYRSFFDAVKHLESEKKCEIYDAIFSYSFEEKEPILSGISASIFTLIKPQLDANRKRFENGCKAKKKSKPEAKQKQTISKTKANDNVNVNVNLNENENLKSELKNLNVAEETWHDFVSFRKEIKKPITSRILKRLLKDLNSFESKKKGNANLALEISIRKSWQDIYEPKPELLGQKNQPEKSDITQKLNSIAGFDGFEKVEEKDDEFIGYANYGMTVKLRELPESKRSEIKSLFNKPFRLA